VYTIVNPPILLFLSLLFFILGSVVGSFLNVIIDRFATNRSVTKGRSYCESCKKTLGPIELVPILSYLFLRGRCRHCKAQIPPRILLVELGCAIALLFLYMQFGLSVVFIILALIVFTSIAIFFIDLEYGIIPDKLTIFLTLVAVIYVYVGDFDPLNHLQAALGALLFFAALYFFTKGRGMGFGDVKISFALGLILGFPMVIYGLYLAFLTGATVSIILVLWKKKSFRTGTVPFGPFLVGSTVFALLFGEKVILPIARMIF